MFEIAKWYNNFQSPAVLMIDDLSDAYINVYKEDYKNDWGYLCNSNGSSFDFLTKELLNNFPEIKITFFIPYLKHAVINENTKYEFIKHALGERQEYTDFLKFLDEQGHEISHHGSDHGEYINKNIVSTVNNWTHEWALFKTVESGVKTTLEGVVKFKKVCDLDVEGGKYCGYISIENSQEIIDKCNFLYWCDKPSYNICEYDEIFFGTNNIISFPTNYPGNSFVRLTYLSGNKKRDQKKKFFKFFQPLYNIYSYFRLYKLYKNQQIISIQEHYSPSTTAGTAQSANIISDINSLKKIFSFLNNLHVWHANCRDISKYIYVRENSTIEVKENQLNIFFDNSNNIANPIISLVNEKVFSLENNNQTFLSIKSANLNVINLPVVNGINSFKIL